MRAVTIILGALLTTGWGSESHLSLKLEVKRAIKLGNGYLTEHRNDNGSWSDDEHPALSALVLTALERDPNSQPNLQADARKESYDWLLSQQQADGGIYTDGLATYNTSIAIMALLANGAGEYHAPIRKARAFLIGQQTNWDRKQKGDNKFDGGIGYGGTYKHSDMSNTHYALEAIYHSRVIALDQEVEEQPTLDWASALEFVSRCQNLPATNDQEWATEEASEKGGFVYFPGSSKAGKKPLKDGQTALRSYGSMSYTGLLSLVFADLSSEDPRVQAVLSWLGDNYSVDENPGMGQQGLYYYYQAMAKALAASGHETLSSSSGEQIDWRRQLGVKLVNTQQSNGAWLNESARWWENDDILVTAYAVLALEQLYSTM